MNNELKVFTNDLFELATKLENGEWVFDAEKVAKDLGIVGVSTKSGGKKYEWIRWERVNEYLGSFQPQLGEVKRGDFIPESAVYKLAFKASNEIAEKFQDWLAIEVIPKLRKGELKSETNPIEKLEIEQQGLKFALDILKPSKSSTVKMLRDFNESQGLSTVYLPAYVDEGAGVAATQLLTEFNIPLSAIKFNKLLIEKGYLEEMKRKSTNKKGFKTYKVLTEKGLQYGKNEVNTKGSEKDSQPLYFRSKFKELVNLIMENVEGD